MREDRAREAQLLKLFYNQAKDRSPGIVQRKLAKDLGVTQSMVAAWFNGHSRCPDRFVAKLSEVLNFDPTVVRPGIDERLNEKVEEDSDRQALVDLIKSLDPTHRSQVMNFTKFLLSTRGTK